MPDIEKAKAALENTASWIDLDWKEGGRIKSALRDAQLDDLDILRALITQVEKGVEVWIQAECLEQLKAVGAVPLHASSSRLAASDVRVILIIPDESETDD